MRDASRRWLLAVLALTCALGGCGFQLRGAKQLPFESIYLNVAATSELGWALRRAIAAGGTTRVVDSPQDAQARFDVLDEATEKAILSLNAAGQITEFQLRYRFTFAVHDGKGKVYVPPSQIALHRDITFNDSQILAKEAEEALMYRDMRNDLVQQILRRLAAARVPE